ncbi:MAG: hypothetical protein HY906_26855 [Deltaproteobacteria bacterium]|nr:hypothetical protein [Deltaproteobacteria bacterium]
MTPTVAQLDVDQARATQIAFGHAGFLGDSVADVGHWIRLHAPEYYLMQALQSRYADATVAGVQYHDGSAWHGLQSALRARLPLERARLEIGYAAGPRLWVNRDSARGAAGSLADFSHEQGGGGWRYFYDQGGTLTPMTWDPGAQCWRGPGTFLLICNGVMHPEGAAPVRTFTVPVTGTVTVEGRVQDADTSCGDGVVASIRRGAQVLWQCALPETGSPCSTFAFDLAATLGDVLAFRVDQGANNWCDSTVFTARVSWDDGQGHDWAIATLDGAVTLPPSGFFAEDASGFRAATMRLPGDAVVDHVASPEYAARARSTTATAAATPTARCPRPA